MEPSTKLDAKFAQKIEEALKWKLEASNRKLVDRVAYLEERTAQSKKLIEIITNECHTEFQDIKNQIVEVTTDVLSSVQDELLP